MDVVRDRQGRRDDDRGARSTGSRSRRPRSPRRSSASATRSSGVRVGLVDRRDAHPDRRARRRRRCWQSSRDRRHKLEDDVARLRDAQAKIQAKLAGVLRRAGAAGPIKPGSGGLIWPVNGPITSPFCESRAWESCHPGIDIGVPSGTPIRAAAAGKVVLMQAEAASGGYGNFTCIQHTGALSTCYAHQSRFATSMGAQRRAGPGDRLQRLHRPLLRRRTCTSRRASTGAVVNPMNYLLDARR